MHVKSDGAFQRYTLGPLGLAASLIILAVSASMNYRFGYSLGKSPLDSLIYGWASVGADILKAIAPFLFFAAVTSRRKAVAVAAGLVWVVTTCYGLTSAAGHAALNRLDTTGQRAVAADSYKDTRSDLSEARKALGFIPAHRGESAVRAELEKLKTNRAWSQTNECGEVGGKAERTFCAQYQTLKGELGNAENATKLTARIDVLTAKLDKVSEGGGAVLSEADPQASILARLSRQDVPTVQLGLALLIVLMLEIGGGLGPYASLWYMTGGVRVVDLKPESAPDAVAAAAPTVALASPLAVLALAGVPSGSPAGPALPAQPAIIGESAIAEAKPEPVPATAGLPKPTPKAADNRPINIFLGRPIPGSEPELRSFGFPVDGRPPGPARSKLPVKDEADQFCRALRAYGMADTPIWRNEVPKLYRQYSIANHREMVEEAALLDVMQRMRSKGVEYGNMRYDGDNKRLSYRIAGKQYPKPKVSNDNTAPKEVGGPKSFPTVSSAEPANDAPPQKPALRIVPRAPAFLSEHERWDIAEARKVKWEATARSRKQRGSRVHKLGRAA
jgi:hypothetical protein